MRILITGTTNGIGRELLLRLAAKENHVIAVNRHAPDTDMQKLPNVSFEQLDVTNRLGVETLITSLRRKDQLPDAFILNAGIHQIDMEEQVDIAKWVEVLNTNLLGVLHFIAPLTALKELPHTVTVMATGSLSNYVPNSHCLGYGVSKNALAEIFHILAARYKKSPLRFKQILLGPVKTRMHAAHPRLSSPVRMVREGISISAAEAAHAMIRFLYTNESCTVFPKRAHILGWIFRTSRRILFLFGNYSFFTR